MNKQAQPTKAIIAVAGFGTRRLPVTKAIEKCLIPVGNRPIVDYLVEDCLRAGVTEIIFVVGEQSEQIRTYYGQNKLLEDYLAQQDKSELLGELNARLRQATFTFVVQDQSQPYGTSTPLWLARHHIAPDEPFLFLYGDAIFYNERGDSVVADFLQQATTMSDIGGAMLAVEVPHEQVSRYGIVSTKQRGQLQLFERIVEKPRPEEAPSNLNNAGCFLLTPEVLPFVKRSMEHSPQKECYVIDALNWYVEAGNEMAVICMNGEFLDCGNCEGWLYANNRILKG